MRAYNKPLYYEIAFSFIDAKKQADLLEKFIAKYSKIKVKRVLDIACGPSLQLREFAKRGYNAIGLDINSQMLEYLRHAAKNEHAKIQTIRADMKNFSLKRKADFAFIMMGSFTFKNNADMLKHLDSVADSLSKGGLYIIENLGFDCKNFKPQTWAMKRGGITVKTVYNIAHVDAHSQTYKEKLTLNVNDNGKKMRFAETGLTTNARPQEFTELIKSSGKFELIGLFERFKLKPLKKIKSNNLVVLRRK